MDIFDRENILGTGITLASPFEVEDFCESIFRGAGCAANADIAAGERAVPGNIDPANAVLRLGMPGQRDYFGFGACVKIYTPNPEIIMKAERDSDYRAALNRGSLVVPDGIGVVLASKFRRGRVRERITGIGLLERLLGFAEKYGRSVFLLGASPGVADAAAAKMLEKFPKLVFAGKRHGYFTVDEERAVAEEIAAANPFLLVAALGAPKQEFFIDRYADIIGATAAIGVGGALDVWAGNVRRAPAFISKIGLEWLYRALSQPSRIPRLAVIPRFILKSAFTRK